MQISIDVTTVCECGAVAHRTEDADGSIRLICPVCVVRLGVVTPQQQAMLADAVRAELAALYPATTFLRMAARPRVRRLTAPPSPFVDGMADVRPDGW